jgi:FkbM family methyltransferase
MPVTWKFRPGTLDQGIFSHVVLSNEYKLPPSFAPGNLVIDVGAHIGAFAHAVVSRGCEDVFCIEADRVNVEIAAENLRPSIEKGYVRLMHGAAWRSDPNEDELLFDGYHPFPKSYTGAQGIINTGSGSVIWGDGSPVPKVAFDEIVDLVTNHAERRVRLLKLDCEGSEWPILLTSQRLHLIDEICGEFHEVGGPFPEISEERASCEPIFRFPGHDPLTVDVLVRLLSDAGFAVTYSRHRRPTGALEGLGLFFAEREDRRVA